MALLQNGYRDASSGAQYSGAGVSNNAYPAALHSNWAKTSRMRNLLDGEGITDPRVGIPFGGHDRSVWMMPRAGGGMAWRLFGAGVIGLAGVAGQPMFLDVVGAGSLTAERTEAILRTLLAEGSGTFTVAIEGRAPLTIDLEGTGDLTATITGLVELAVALSGAGEIAPELVGLVQAIVAWAGSSAFSADVAGLSQMLATLSGTGEITLDALGRFAMLVALSGAGDLDLTVFGTAHPVVALSGDGDLDALTTAFGDMSIDIVVTGAGLSTQSIAAAVWGALASASNDPNTMGQKLNDAGSAGNPWNTLIEAGYTAEQVLRVIAAAVAGASSGGPDGPIVFKGLDGTTNRISGAVDGDGNRSSVVLDVD